MGERVNYFDRQLLRAEDFRLEQEYHIARRRGLSAGMFRGGVATGLEVVRVDAGSVLVTAGLAIDGFGREIALDADSGVIPADPAATVEIWIAYAEAPSHPVSYLDGAEPRFARIDEAPAIVPVPPGSVPADGIRLAVVPPGGDPDMSARPLAGPRHASVTGPSLADDAVTSRVLAAADGGASGQDAASGSGVKTDHIQNKAVTSDKLADEVVEGLAERTIETVLATGVPIADRSIASDKLADQAVSARALADDAVPSRALAEAAAGSADQDTGSGTGVKTGHLTDKAVTAPKLADGAVMFEKLATKRVFDEVVTVPRATGDITQPSLTPGRLVVDFERWTSDQPAFYLIYVRPLAGQAAITWKHRTINSFVVGGLLNGVEIENHAIVDADVRCIAYRVGSLSD